MRRETVRSLPGMARAERTTVSPGPAATSRCSPTLIIERAESGSPWLPETKTTARLPASPEREPGAIRESSGSRSRPRSRATSALSTMRRPRKETGRRARTARSATRCMRGIDVAKQETRTRPRVRASTSSKAGTTSSSPPVVPGCSTPVLSESRARTPRSPQWARDSRSVRSAGVAAASILKSPLAITVPAGVSMARARLSRTLWATWIGWTRKGPISSSRPGVSSRRSAVTPRSWRRLRAKPRVSGLP